MWVEFVVGCPCCKRFFFSGTPAVFSSQKPTFLTKFQNFVSGECPQIVLCAKYIDILLLFLSVNFKT